MKSQNNLKNAYIISFFSFFILFSIFSKFAKADFYEITNPSEMVNCMKNYILDWLVAPETVGSWEHEPAYIFAGKYVHASWHTNPLLNYGSLGMMLGPTSIVYCDYEVNEDGTPDYDKPGFCKATVENADVLFDYMEFKNGKEINSQKKIALIIESKIICLNLSL